MDTFSRHTLAKIRVALPGQALSCPLGSESIVTIALLATANENAVSQLSGECEIDKRRRQHPNAGHRDDTSTTLPQRAGSSRVLTAENDHAGITG
jgi:hypothetical protein